MRFRGCLTLLAWALAGCADVPSAEPADPTFPEKRTLAGTLGPLLQGAEIRVHALADFVPSTEHQWETTAPGGQAYELVVPVDTPLELRATGSMADASTGEYQRVELRGRVSADSTFFEPSALSHLLARRIGALDGRADDPEATAQAELQVALGLLPDSVLPLVSAQPMFGIDDDASSLGLTTSALVSQLAEQRKRARAPRADHQSLLDELAADFADDGAFVKVLADEVALARSRLSPPLIRIRLGRLLGPGDVLPDVGRVLDRDGDGTVDRDDGCPLWPGNVGTICDTDRNVFTLDSNIDHLAAGDVDGDGIDELLLARGRTLTLYRDGALSLTARLPSGFSLPPWRTALYADLDGDGFLDLLAGDSSQLVVATLPGVSDFEFGEPRPLLQEPVDFNDVVFSGFHDYDVGDVNGDGLLDLLGVFESAKIAVMLGLEDGSFAPPVGFVAPDVGFQAQSFPGFVGGVDFDSDGRADAVVGGERGIHVLFGAEDGQLQPQPFNPVLPPGESLRPYASGDFDGDGSPDLLVTRIKYEKLENGVSYEVLRNVGAGRFERWQSFEARPSAFHVADVNGDGLDDVVRLSETGWLEAISWLGDAWVPLIREHVPHPLVGYALTSGDFDGDGLRDIAFCQIDPRGRTELHLVYPRPAAP